MKNKQVTYLLGAVVALIWGIIIYRIVDAYSGGDDGAITAVTKPKKEAYNDFEIAKDTTHLLLNYRDPFGIVKERDTIEVHIKAVHKNVAVIAKPAMNWGFIKYSGYILNPDSKKAVALMNINGKSAMMAEGDMADNVKLVKNMHDSVKIVYNGQAKFIHKNR